MVGAGRNEWAMNFNGRTLAAAMRGAVPSDLADLGEDNGEIVERAFVLAESGRYASLEEVKRELKREGYVTVETALRARLTRREIRAACARACRT